MIPGCCTIVLFPLVPISFMSSRVVPRCHPGTAAIPSAPQLCCNLRSPRLPGIQCNSYSTLICAQVARTNQTQPRPQSKFPLRYLPCTPHPRSDSLGFAIALPHPTLDPANRTFYLKAPASPPHLRSDSLECSLALPHPTLDPANRTFYLKAQAYRPGYQNPVIL